MTTDPTHPGVAIVTGGSRGIGRAFVAAASQRGYHVVFGHRERHEAATRVVESVRAEGGHAIAVAGDLTTEVARENLVDAARDAGPITLLVNNVGVTVAAGIEDVDEERWDRSLRINLEVPLWLTQVLAQDLVESRGAVLNVASVAGLVGSAYSLPYAASKAGLIGLTKTLARMLAPHVRVNALCPGPTDTDLLEGVEPEDLEALVAGALIPRLADPEEIATAGLDVCEWKYCTGQAIVIDGGRVLH